MQDNGVKLLEEEHFNGCPVWQYDEHSDLYYRVSEPDEMPENTKDLRIKVELFTPPGLTFDGYICGFDRVFSPADSFDPSGAAR